MEIYVWMKYKNGETRGNKPIICTGTFNSFLPDTKWSMHLPTDGKLKLMRWTRVASFVSKELLSYISFIRMTGSSNVTWLFKSQLTMKNCEVGVSQSLQVILNNYSHLKVLSQV